MFDTNGSDGDQARGLEETSCSNPPTTSSSANEAKTKNL